MAVAKSFGIILVGAVLVVAITVPIILLIPQPIVLKELVEVTGTGGWVSPPGGLSTFVEQNL